MQLRQLFDDESAVSPVIGVILMVAITVILAAVIGTFVLGLGDQVSQSQPSANIGFNYTDQGGSVGYVVGVTHKGGDKLDGNDLTLSIAGASEPMTNLGGGAYTLYGANGWNDNSITAGDQVVVYNPSPNIANGDEIDVIWSADNGDSAIIAEGTVQ